MNKNKFVVYTVMTGYKEESVGQLPMDGVPLLTVDCTKGRSPFSGVDSIDVDKNKNFDC